MEPPSKEEEEREEENKKQQVYFVLERGCLETGKIGKDFRFDLKN